MNLTFAYVGIILLTSCGEALNNKSVVTNESKSYEEFVKENAFKKPTTDTIALGFTLGQDENQVDKHYDLLIKQGKVDSRTTWTLPMFDTKVNIEGYPYELVLNDSTVCQTLIGNTFYNSKLATMSFFGKSNASILDIVKFMENKFGKYQTMEINSSDDTSYYWFNGYKEVAVRQAPLVDFVMNIMI